MCNFSYMGDFDDQAFLTDSEYFEILIFAFNFQVQLSSWKLKS